MTLSAQSVIKELRQLGTPAKAKASARFSKIEKGEYGYGDFFWGVTVPEQRKIAKQYLTLDLKEIAKLLKSQIHECRRTALLILVNKYRCSNEATQAKIVQFYLKHKKRVNNWGLVDSSASYILGDYLLRHDRSVLYRLAGSQNLWERRIAIIATLAFIRANHYQDTLKIAKLLLYDSHDLIHKAVGWMLREVGKKSLPAEEEFLRQHAKVMPRTMLRYAIEKFPEEKRQMYKVL